jgi:hypothetical protein
MLVTELEKHGKEAVVNCLGIEQLGKAAQILRKDQLHTPFVLRLGNALLVLNILEELVAILGPHLL